MGRYVKYFGPAASAIGAQLYRNYYNTGTISGSKYVDGAVSGAYNSVASRLKSGGLGSRYRPGHSRTLVRSAKFRKLKGRRSARRSTGSAGGMLAGKLRRPKRRPKKTTAYKMRGGIQEIQETGKLLTADEVQYIGHITHPQYTVLRMMWGAVLKTLMGRAGTFITDANLEYPSLTTDRIIVVFKPSPSSALVSHTINMTLNQTLESLQNALTSVTCPWMTNPPTYAMQEFAFCAIQFKATIYNPSMNSCYLDLGNASIKYNCKSSLKMQNRSVTVATNVEDNDVDNVPLYGKRYAGSGTGCRLATASNDSVLLFGHYDYGLIQKSVSSVSNTVDNDTQEPPAPHLFPEVKKWSKINIQPGEIKTSVLTSSGSVKFNTLFQKLMFFFASSTHPKRSIGKFEFMALEKVLDATDLIDSIKIAIERQWTGHFHCSAPVQNAMSAFFRKTYL